MKKVVLSLGGSLIVPNDIRVEFLQQFRELIISKLDTHQFVIFTGGGNIARLYQTAGNEIVEMSNEQLDWIGIQASHMNAQLVKQLFIEHVADKIIIDPTLPLNANAKITVGGGWKPGWSTDYDAVQVAVNNGYERVVNLSNITYVYDKDPNQFEDAQKIEDITWADFRKIVGDEWKPGLNAPFDPIASQLAEKHALEVIIANGSDIANVEAIIEGDTFIGTTIHS